jgi:hypothetical protein
LLSAAAASPRHLQFVFCVDKRRVVVAFPTAASAAVSSNFAGLHNRAPLVIVEINPNPPADEECEQDAAEDDDFAAVPSDSESDGEWS